ncbi:hypothetical protein Csa_011319 [Cucumis sativus]|uniref:Uncharacterized protein n=1 Tax=Cucumis sativus TaxID=3659 RepID=A0A0A0LDB2_CUCSA|nr:hypothetical protein Csa_011319 [Cucumis sativus]
MVLAEDGLEMKFSTICSLREHVVDDMMFETYDLIRDCMDNAIDQLKTIADDLIKRSTGSMCGAGGHYAYEVHFGPYYGGHQVLLCDNP